MLVASLFLLLLAAFCYATGYLVAVHARDSQRLDFLESVPDIRAFQLISSTCPPVDCPSCSDPVEVC